MCGLFVRKYDRCVDYDKTSESLVYEYVEKIPNIQHNFMFVHVLYALHSEM
jgi:hypothetical protein